MTLQSICALLLGGCVYLPDRVAAELQPAAASDSNNYRIEPAQVSSANSSNGRR
jgi:hypothetical protein